MNRLNEKIILVIGAGGGIGAACVRRLAGEGALVMSSDLPGSGAKEGAAFRVSCDVTSIASLDNLYCIIRKEVGRLDGFVYCSGLGSSKGFLETSIGHFDEIMAVNLRGAFYASQKAAELMKTGGSMVFIASQKGLCGSTGSLAYNTSKAGMVVMARSMALELGVKGIRVNCVCPGPTETAMFQDDMRCQQDPAGAREKVAASNPLHKITDPAQIAAGIAYIISDEADFVTGTELVIDGGSIAGVRNI